MTLSQTKPPSCLQGGKRKLTVEPHSAEVWTVPRMAPRGPEDEDPAPALLSPRLWPENLHLIPISDTDDVSPGTPLGPDESRETPPFLKKRMCDQDGRASKLSFTCNKSEYGRSGTSIPRVFLTRLFQTTRLIQAAVPTYGGLSTLNE